MKVIGIKNFSLVVFILLVSAISSFAYIGQPPLYSEQGAYYLNQNNQPDISAQLPYKDKERQKELSQSQLFQDFKRRNGKPWTVIWNEGNESAHYLGMPKPLDITNGGNFNERDLSPEQIENFTREFILNEPLFNVKSPEELKKISLKKLGTKKSLTQIIFQQKYEGLDVYRSRIFVRLLSSGKVTAVSSDFHPDIHLDVHPNISGNDAIASVMTGIDADNHAVVSQGPKLLVLPELTDDGHYEYFLAYEIWIRTADPVSQYSYFVNAQNGEVLSSFDTASYFGMNQEVRGNVKAKAFENDYDASTEYERMVIPTDQIVYLDGVPAAVVDSLGNYLIPLTGNGSHQLLGQIRGQYAQVFMHHNSGPTASYVVDDIPPDGGVYNYQWEGDGSNSKYSETTTFQQIHKLANYFDQTMEYNLGYSIPATVDNPTWYAANDSYFIAGANGTGELFLGAGGDIVRPMGRFPQVILHETMHAVTYSITEDTQYPDELDEAFSDYFASTTNEDPVIGHYLYQNNHRSYLRLIDNQFRLYEDSFPEIHTQSTILSGAMWDLRKRIGKEIADELFFIVLQTQPQTFDDFLIALLEMDDYFYGDYDVRNGTPHFTDIYETFVLKHSIAGLQLTNKYVNEGEDFDFILENTDSKASFSLTFLNDAFENELFSDVTITDIEVNHAGFPLQSAKLDEDLVYDWNWPLGAGQGNWLIFNVDFSGMKFIPYDDYMNVKLQLNVGNLNLPFTYERKIRIPVGWNFTNINEMQNDNYLYQLDYPFSLNNNRIAFLCLHTQEVYINIGGYAFYSLNDFYDANSEYRGDIGLDNKNIVWNKYEKSGNNGGSLWIYNLGPDNIPKTQDDILGRRINSSVKPKTHVSIHGRYIVYIGTDNRVHYVDIGEDLLYGTADDAGDTAISTAQGIPGNVDVHNGRIVYSVDNLLDNDADRVHLYTIATGQDRIICNPTYQDQFCLDPVIGDRWIAWEEKTTGSNPAIMGYDLGEDGNYGTQDDLGPMLLSPSDSSSILTAYTKPRISGEGDRFLIFFDDAQMRIKIRDLKTHKIFTGREYVTPRYFDSMDLDVQGNIVAMPYFKKLDNNFYKPMIERATITYGENTYDEVELMDNEVITSATTFTNEKPYLIKGQLLVWASLVINPGAQLRFFKNSGSIRLVGEGTLTANGGTEAENRILFIKHSYQDGQVTNGDGVYSESTAAGTVVDISNATFSGLNHGITLGSGISTSNYRIKNSLFIDQRNNAIVLANNGTTDVSNNTITENEFGIAVYSQPTGFYQIKNNIISTNNQYGINVVGQWNGNLQYNNIWGNGTNYFGIGPANTDISENPSFENPDSHNYQLKDISKSIDHGDPNDPVGLEPSPNGGRINQGVYGGTIEAKISRLLGPPRGGNCGRGPCAYEQYEPLEDEHGN